MSRSVTGELAAQLATQSVKYALFVEMFFDSGTLRVHNAVGTINATESGGAARDWFGAGDLGSIGTVQEETELKSSELPLVLSGLDSTMTNIALNESPSGRVAQIFVGVFNENDALSGNLTFLWRGRMDRMEMAFGEEANTVSVVCENEATTLLRTRMGYFTDATQQQRFSGDRGFEYLPQLPFHTVQWAGKTVTARTPFRTQAVITWILR